LIIQADTEIIKVEIVCYWC